MNRGERSTTTGILIAVALVLAVVIGAAIPWASGGAPGQRAVAWTPPSVTPDRPPSVTPTPARPRTATAQPTAAPFTATPTRPPATATPAPAVTDLPAQATPSPAPAQRSSEASPAAPAASETPEGAPVATVRQGLLSIRTQPNTTAGAIALARAGDTFTVTGRSADDLWLKVCCVRDTQGWLAAEFVDVAGSLRGIPTVAPSR